MPRSISRVTDSAVKISMVMVRMVPTRPGTMLSERRRRRDCSGRACGSRTATVSYRGRRDRAGARSSARAFSAPTAPSPRRPDRWHRPRPASPGGRRGAPRARSLPGISIANSTVPDASSWSNSASSCDLIRDLEVARVLERAQDRAAEIALLLQQHRGRQIARIGVDGVAEQQELHQRDHDDHRERDAVALELDELLDQHRDRATPEAADGDVLRSRWNVDCARVIGNCPAPWPGDR